MRNIEIILNSIFDPFNVIIFGLTTVACTTIWSSKMLISKTIDAAIQKAEVELKDGEMKINIAIRK